MLALAAPGEERRSAPGSEPEPQTAAAPRGSDLAADLRRQLEPLLDTGTASLEESCPQPALLACRPAAQLSGDLTGRPSPRLQRRVGGAVRSVLRRDGYRRLEVRVEGQGGRVVSGVETLARWRAAGDEIEVATGGLTLDR